MINNKQKTYSKEIVASVGTKQVITVTESLTNLFSVDKIKTIDDAEIVIQASDKIASISAYARAKVFQRVHEQELYKQAKAKTFDSWAKSRYGLGKTQVYSILKVAPLINEQGTGTILFHASKLDFDMQPLVTAFDCLKTIDKNDRYAKLVELAENEIIKPNMTVKDIKKALRSFSGLDLTEEIEQDLTEEIEQDLTEEIEQDLTEEIEQDLTEEIEQDLTEEIEQNKKEYFMYIPLSENQVITLDNILIAENINANEILTLLKEIGNYKIETKAGMRKARKIIKD